MEKLGCSGKFYILDLQQVNVGNTVAVGPAYTVEMAAAGSDFPALDYHPVKSALNILD